MEGPCAICHENTLREPVMLRCSHIFCAECVEQWFERRPICPLCRAVVRSPALRTYGDGSTQLMVQLF